jgi:hypothetical protein
MGLRCTVDNGGEEKRGGAQFADRDGQRLQIEEGCPGRATTASRGTVDGKLGCVQFCRQRWKAVPPVPHRSGVGGTNFPCSGSDSVIFTAHNQRQHGGHDGELHLHIAVTRCPGGFRRTEA